MALLLPFNIATIWGYCKYYLHSFEKDKFLNMTLDFMLELLAIDSAKTLGFPIDVEIYDSRETKIIQLLPR
jgi:hypothetical protein